MYCDASGSILGTKEGLVFPIGCSAFIGSEGKGLRQPSRRTVCPIQRSLARTAWIHLHEDFQTEYFTRSSPKPSSIQAP